MEEKIERVLQAPVEVVLVGAGCYQTCERDWSVLMIFANRRAGNSKKADHYGDWTSQCVSYLARKTS